MNHEASRSIIDQMARVGLYFPSDQDLEVYRNDGIWNRFKPVQSPYKRSKEAWYRIYEHQLKSGRIVYTGCFGIAGEKYLIEHEQRRWSDEEWKEIQSKRSEDDRQIEQAIIELHKQAAEKALQMLESGTYEVSPDHPYVKAKRIQPVGAKQLGDKILIPLYRDQKLRGLQQIFPGKDEDTGKEIILKTFLKGSDIKGSYAPLRKVPDKPEIIYVVEGWATGCTVYQCTGKPVIVAFNAGNLYPVVESIRARYPDTKIVIAADNDCRYERKLRQQLKEKYNLDLKISAFAKNAETQVVETPEGKAEFKAYWTKEDQETTLVYCYKLPGQQKASRVKYQNTGEIKARSAASKFGAYAISPYFNNKESMGTDFNDLYCEEGAEETIKQLYAYEITKLPPVSPKESKSPSKPKIDPNDERGMARVKTLAERYVCIDGKEELWDLQYKRRVKISVARQYEDGKVWRAWIQNDFGNRKMIQPEQLVFEPDPKKLKPGEISTWTGWGIEPKSGDCSLIKEHLLKICGGNYEIFDWVLKWLAYPLQHVGAKMMTALIVYGEREGTGKSMFFDVMKKIYGDSACTVNQSTMVSDFNGWIESKLFVVAEEVISSADRKHKKGELKNIVTSHEHYINRKMLDQRSEVNKTNLVFLSNELTPLALDLFDRRYMVIKFNEQSSHQYFSDLYKEIQNGGAEAFFYDLLHLDLEDFCESTPAIETEAKRELKLLTGDSFMRFYHDWIKGELTFPAVPVEGNYLHQAYMLWAQNAGEKYNLSLPVMRKRLATIMCSKRVRVRMITEDSLSDSVKTIEERQRTIYFPKVEPDDTEALSHYSEVDLNMSVQEFQRKVFEAKRRIKNNGIL